MMIYYIATTKVVRGSTEQRQPFIKAEHFFLQASRRIVWWAGS